MVQRLLKIGAELSQIVATIKHFGNYYKFSEEGDLSLNALAFDKHHFPV